MVAVPRWTVIAVAALSAFGFGDARAAGVPLESRLFFASNRTGVWQIYSVSRAGTALVQLTRGRVDAHAPQPSPDGTRVAFVRAGRVWIMRASGVGSARDVGPAPGFQPALAWSRDSTRLAVGNVVVDVARRRARLLPTAGATAIGWSYDGRRIFVSELVSSWTSTELRVSSLAVASGSRQLLVSSAIVPFVTPAVSANGLAVAFVDGARRLTRVTLDRRGVSAGPNEDVGPYEFEVGSPQTIRWAPNGRALAFIAPRCEDAVCMLSAGIGLADRQGVRTLTADPSVRTIPAYNSSSWAAPAWTPGGDALAYSGVQGIRLASLSGSVRTLLPTAREGAEVADLVWQRVTPPVRGARAEDAPPLAEAGADEVRSRHRIDELAADGERVAFLSCDNVGMWRVGDQPSWLGPSVCPTQLRAWNPGSLALSELGTGYVVWSPGGNSQHFQAVVVRPASVVSDAVASAMVCCTGSRRSGTAVGAMLGAGRLLVFSRWTVSCPSFFGDPACATSAGAQEVWRLRDAATPGACPDACRLVASSRGPIAPLAADGARVVLRLEGGALDIVTADGEAVRRFGFAPGEAAAAAIDGDDLVVVVPRLLLHFSIATGALVHSWPLASADVGGFCPAAVRAQCTSATLRLEGARRGVAAYLLAGELHTLRLADGRDTTVHAATAARFGSAGLFYAYAGDAPWPGRIRFVPFERLP